MAFSLQISPLERFALRDSSKLVSTACYWRERGQYAAGFRAGDKLEHFIVSLKRQNAPSACFVALPNRKTVATFAGRALVYQPLIVPFGPMGGMGFAEAGEGQARLIEVLGEQDPVGIVGHRALEDAGADLARHQAIKIGAQQADHLDQQG
mgnify:CR=1 FL=1